MRRIALVLAISVAVFVPVGVSAQASPAPGNPNGQLVRDPNGQLVSARPGTHTSGQQQAKKDRPPAALPAAAGTGCTYGTYGGTSQYFCHAGAYQYLASHGAYMSTPVQSPFVFSGDSHSLAELAVESADGQQIIEIGWSVDPVLKDETPRLFVYHWVNGQGTCYNACGFVLNGSSSITPGMALTSSSTPTQFAIEYFQGNWWYGYNGTWFGYLPEATVWGGTFTQSGLVQMFGEVASTVAKPCTHMGNGIPGSSPNAAAVTGVGYYNTPTAVNLALSIDDPMLYDSQVDPGATSFRYGGYGTC